MLGFLRSFLFLDHVFRLFGLRELEQCYWSGVYLACYNRGPDGMYRMVIRRASVVFTLPATTEPQMACTGWSADQRQWCLPCQLQQSLRWHVQDGHQTSVSGVYLACYNIASDHNPSRVIRPGNDRSVIDLCD